MKNRNFISTVLSVSIVLVGLAFDSCKEESQSLGVVKVKIMNKDEKVEVKNRPIGNMNRKRQKN